MEPKIFHLDQLILVGFSFFGDPFAESDGWTEENEIGRLWQRFMRYMQDHPGAIQHLKNEDVAYEVHVEGEETRSRGHREVFVGVAVARLADVPVELLVKILPAATYAVFSLKGEQIASDWSMSIGQWVRNSAYEAITNYGFQRYDERFRGVDNLAESELDVYVPLKRVDDVSTDGDL